MISYIYMNKSLSILAHRFLLCRIDFSRDDGFVGDVFIHFYDFDENVEDEYSVLDLSVLL